METDLNNMKQLEESLATVANKIQKSYEEQEDNLKKTKGRFNVFTTLRKAHEEVGLHSKFLALLLDANGLHDCDDLFLNLFLEVLNEEGVYNHYEELVKDVLNKHIEDVFKRTEREKRKKDSNGKNYGDIDIGIFFKDSVIVIENKIYHHEEREQIERYCNYVNDGSGKENKAVLYLTLDGKKSKTAGKHEKNYYRISYSQHIRKWLDRCIEESSQHQNICHVIQQYKNVADQLTGNTLEGKAMEGIKKLIERNPSIMKYRERIYRAATEVREEQIKSLIDKVNEHLNEYSFSYSSNKPFVLHLNNNDEFLFDKSSIKINWDNNQDLYIGLATDDWELETQNSFIEKNENTIDEIFKAASNEMEEMFWKQNEYWPAATFVLQRNFNTDDYLSRLLCKKAMQEQAKEIADKVKVFVDIVLENWKQS